uniref:Uncharacterized protein n=1 Tax=Panagrolaimus sp. JU765 TaxID=591449 RepID=A0AC34R2B7_9BILA
MSNREKVETTQQSFASRDAAINSIFEDDDGAKNVDIVGTAVDLSAIETESKPSICNLQTARLNLNGDDTSAQGSAASEDSSISTRTDLSPSSNKSQRAQPKIRKQPTAVRTDRSIQSDRSHSTKTVLPTTPTKSYIKLSRSDVKAALGKRSKTADLSTLGFWVIQFMSLVLWFLVYFGRILLFITAKIVSRKPGPHRVPKFIKRVLFTFIEDFNKGNYEDAPQDMEERKDWRKKGFVEECTEIGKTQRQSFYVVIKSVELPYDLLISVNDPTSGCLYSISKKKKCLLYIWNILSFMESFKKFEDLEGDKTKLAEYFSNVSDTDFASHANRIIITKDGSKVARVENIIKTSQSQPNLFAKAHVFAKKLIKPKFKLYEFRNGKTVKYVEKIVVEEESNSIEELYNRPALASFQEALSRANVKAALGQKTAVSKEATTDVKTAVSTKSPVTTAKTNFDNEKNKKNDESSKKKANNDDAKDNDKKVDESSKKKVDNRDDKKKMDESSKKKADNDDVKKKEQYVKLIDLNNSTENELDKEKEQKKDKTSKESKTLKESEKKPKKNEKEKSKTLKTTQEIDSKAESVKTKTEKQGIVEGGPGKEAKDEKKEIDKDLVMDSQAQKDEK